MSSRKTVRVALLAWPLLTVAAGCGWERSQEVDSINFRWVHPVKQTFEHFLAARKGSNEKKMAMRYGPTRIGFERPLAAVGDLVHCR
jgi:hypothetical protein